MPSGNGALIAWTAWTTDYSNPVFWGTRALNMDGTPRSPVVSHAPFPVKAQPAGYDSMSLAVTPQCAFGLLAWGPELADGNGDSGCSVVPVDGDGNEIGPPGVSLPVDVGGSNTSNGCTDLGPAPGGFSYIQQVQSYGVPSDLVTVGTNGSPLLKEPLGIQQPPGTIAGFSRRLVLDDESFLLVSYFEHVSDASDTVVITHHDAAGMQLAPGTTLSGAYAGDLILAKSTRGDVLAAYIDSDPATQSGQALYIVPLSHDGVPMATPVAVPIVGAADSPFDFALDPSPSGDMILTWVTYDQNPSAPTGFFAAEIDPAGSPRGPALRLGASAGNVSVVVSTDGAHALVVYTPLSGNAGGVALGVHTLPLECAMH